MQAPFRPYWLPILSGILIGTSYIPFPPWAIFFLFVPLWQFWLQADSLKKILIGGWITQAVLTLIGFNWVTYTIHEFGHLPWALSILGFFLFAAIAHLHIPLAGFLWRSLRKIFKTSPQQALWLLPAAHLACEMLYPMIFDWHLGYTLLWGGLPLAQLAEWVGFRGLSGLILLFNAATLVLWQGRHVRTRPWWFIAFASAACFIFLNGIGALLPSLLPPTDDTAKVLIVQANIGNQEKLQAETGDFFREVILQKYIDLTEKGLKERQPDFVVWPETAFPHLLSEPHFSSSAYAARLKEFLKDRKLFLATGAYSLHPRTDQVMNSFFTLDGEGRVIAPAYSKTHLLAFGEYFPLSDQLPFLHSLLPQVGTFGRGEGPQVLPLGRFSLGPQICYESLFDAFTRSLAKQNAQLIVNVTNDSWYGDWQEPWQHLYMTLARAIEVRRPLIRATNTGISTVVLANGKILEQSPLNQEWHGYFEVPLNSNPKKTLFMGWGFYFAWVLIGALLIFAFLVNRRVPPA